jgi:hypothetical protein
MGTLVRFKRLSKSERSLVYRAIVLIWVTRVGLWLLPFKWVDDWLNNLYPEPQVEVAIGWAAIKRVTSIVEVCSRYVPRATCLTQALVTRTLLARSGQCSKLRLGVQKKNSVFKAHAWVEVNGKVVIGGSPGRLSFTVLRHFSERI